MRTKTLLSFALLGFLLAPFSAQAAKSKKPAKKKAATSQTSAAKEDKPTQPEATATPIPQTQPLAEPTREGVNTEAGVKDVNGTIMVQHMDQTAPTALQTGSTVEKGDEIRVYDGGWVIFKSRKGDLIGLGKEAIVSIDEYYFEGPDRQIRLILHQGTLYLKTTDSSSRQSFFEVQAGNQVVALGDVEAQLDFDPVSGKLVVQYFHGKMKVIDKESEKKLSAEGTENTWEQGKMVGGGGQPMDEMTYVNFNRFFHSEDPLVDFAKDVANNVLLDTAQGGIPVGGAGISMDVPVGSESGIGNVGSVETREALNSYKMGKLAYSKKDYRAAKHYWEESLTYMPNYWAAQSALDTLKRDHPEVK